MSPLPAPFPFLDHPTPIPFAHRGGAGDWPENSMLAFEGAVRLGYRYVETDVHCTSDGVLVAFHDSRLDRVTDGHGIIADLPWSTVSKARIDGKEPIPLFEDLLGTFPDLRVNIDPKKSNAVGPLADAISRCRAVDRVCVGSFSDERVASVRKLVGPALCTGMGPKAVGYLRLASLGVPSMADRVRSFGNQCAQVPVRQGPIPVTDRRFVATAHGLGIQVHVWTIDDAARMDNLLDLGVDGIMTDRPIVLREVLQRRGQWVD